MDLPDLLFALNQKLNRITATVRAYPEARLALIIAINRLNQLKDSESNTSPQLPPDQSPNPDRNQLNQMFQSFMHSIS
ncbi:MAG: hypothetical protein WA634_01285 [Silvibacterium sp.]